ncbi:hypothetical protein HanXRQr2_Chr14g0628041 [Helianthus annuus]|uniref:Uncharacterized protein n=1 Tax=Helianthus annuus TaxID=4232 RepID=A0A9K3E666_HELAN|nr:hypothetical protein HanXRQr2_Chr14g0628041 [Helianthus annuus]KAJ0839071.1 hypothetical protein HanPSC8_Chr14g0602521 [Helianthus annuus]
MVMSLLRGVYFDLFNFSTTSRSVATTTVKGVLLCFVKFLQLNTTCTSDGSKGGEGGCGRMMWWRKARERLNLERERERVERERTVCVHLYTSNKKINKLSKITNSPSCATHMSNLIENFNQVSAKERRV